MSQREVMLVLAHAQLCPGCRQRLVLAPAEVFVGRNLSGDERKSLTGLTSDDFITPELLARAMHTSVEELRVYADHPIARLRHF